MIAKLKRKSARYPDLSVGHPYVVIGIEADDLRILNNAGRPSFIRRASSRALTTASHATG